MSVQRTLEDLYHRIASDQLEREEMEHEIIDKKASIAAGRITGTAPLPQLELLTAWCSERLQSEEANLQE